MYMARSSDRLSADAYTRASVEAYLQAAAEQRAKIQLAIADAERRRQQALDTLARLEKLDVDAPTTTGYRVPPGESFPGNPRS